MWLLRGLTESLGRHTSQGLGFSFRSVMSSLVCGLWGELSVRVMCCLIVIWCLNRYFECNQGAKLETAMRPPIVSFNKSWNLKFDRSELLMVSSDRKVFDGILAGLYLLYFWWHSCVDTVHTKIQWCGRARVGTTIGTHTPYLTRIISMCT